VHAHHALQLSFGWQEELHLRRGVDANWTGYRACLIPADLPHALDSTGRTYAIIFVDPETPEGQRLRAQAAPDAITPLDTPDAHAAAERIFGTWAESQDCARLEPAAREAVQLLAGTEAPRRPIDPRVLGAIELIRARLGGRVTLGEVARELHVSPSRLRHLFVEEVGLPFRTYVLWQRLQRVIRGLGTESLSHAALAAGFADAAHMTRTFRRMIGVAPSAMTRDSPASK
jgi:AraC-like DNA-binding protein